MMPSGPDPWEREQPGPAEPGAARTLHAGSGAIRLRGGPLLSVDSLLWRGEELLLGASALPPQYRVHGMGAGVTLLHPWANRLGADAYRILGREARVSDRDGARRLTRDGNGLAIHGLLADPGWQLTAGPAAGSPAGAAPTARARLDFPGDPAFPFPHRMDVAITLGAGEDGRFGLTVATTLEAGADGPVPVSFGWHPYFRRTPASWLALPAHRAVAADGRGLPTGAESPTGAERVGLVDPHLDDGIAGLADGARMSLENPSEHITVELLEGYGWGQVFAPADAPVVSLEPMTAPTDALRRGACPVIAPGERYTATFRVLVGSPAGP